MWVSLYVTCTMAVVPGTWTASGSMPDRSLCMAGPPQQGMLSLAIFLRQCQLGSSDAPGNKATTLRSTV